MGDIEYINDFVDKHFKSIRQDNIDNIKYVLVNIYKKEITIILFINDIEQKINSGGLLIPLGLFNELEKKYPLLLFDILEKLQMRLKND